MVVYSNNFEKIHYYKKKCRIFTKKKTRSMSLSYLSGYIYLTTDFQTSVAAPQLFVLNLTGQLSI